MIEAHNILDQKGVILGRREEEFIDHVADSFAHRDGLRGRRGCSSCNDHPRAQAIFEPVPSSIKKLVDDATLCKGHEGGWGLLEHLLDLRMVEQMIGSATRDHGQPGLHHLNNDGCIPILPIQTD
jgi:hypothetical protein